MRFILLFLLSSLLYSGNILDKENLDFLDSEIKVAETQLSQMLNEEKEKGLYLEDYHTALVILQKNFYSRYNEYLNKAFDRSALLSKYLKKFLLNNELELSANEIEKIQDRFIGRASKAIVADEVRHRAIIWSSLADKTYSPNGKFKGIEDSSLLKVCVSDHCVDSLLWLTGYPRLQLVLSEYFFQDFIDLDGNLETRSTCFFKSSCQEWIENVVLRLMILNVSKILFNREDLNLKFEKNLSSFEDEKMLFEYLARFVGSAAEKIIYFDNKSLIHDVSKILPRKKVLILLGNKDRDTSFHSFGTGQYKYISREIRKSRESKPFAIYPLVGEDAEKIEQLRLDAIDDFKSDLFGDISNDHLTDLESFFEQLGERR